MDESDTRGAGVLPVAQLATCVLATALGFVYVVDALGGAPVSWPGVVARSRARCPRERVVAARR